MNRTSEALAPKLDREKINSCAAESPLRTHTPLPAGPPLVFTSAPLTEHDSAVLHGPVSRQGGTRSLGETSKQAGLIPVVFSAPGLIIGRVSSQLSGRRQPCHIRSGRLPLMC